MTPGRIRALAANAVLSRQHFVQEQIDAIEQAIRAALVEELSAAPSEAVLGAGRVAWMQNNHGEPYDQEIPMIYTAMAAVKLAEIEGKSDA